MVTPPVKVLAPERVSVPLPDLMILPVTTAPLTMLVVEPITPLRTLVVPLPANSYEPVVPVRKFHCPEVVRFPVNLAALAPLM